VSRHLGVLMLAALPLAAQTVTYDVSVLPADNLFHVKADFPAAGKDTLYLSLPAWSPGNYEIQNYARYVRHFTARGADGQSLFWDRFDKDTWRVTTGKRDRVTVEFDYLADTVDLSIARVRTDWGQFLGTNLFLYEEGQLARPAAVRFALPSGWRVTTALAPGAGGTYTAPDYHTLADAETFVGRYALDSLQVAGHWIRLALYPQGDYTPTVAKNLRDVIQRAAASQDELMGGAPYDTYTIFFSVIHEPVSFGGGLEHAASQYDIMPAGPDFADEGGQLGSFIRPLIAHEFFHLWNVKRIRPAEMWPYDYHAEQFTPLLWWSEGVTDYYADLTNVRSRLWTDSDFLKNIAANMREVGAALEPWSEEDGSVATWINEVYVNSSQLYYPKGSLTGLLLDVSIRDATDNKHSLDDVMRGLFTRYYKQGKGFTTANLLALLKEAGLPDPDRFYARYINGRDPLPYDSALAKAGIVVTRHSESTPLLGVSSGLTADGQVEVQGVQPGSSAAEAGMEPGDVLLQVGDVTIRGDQDWGEAFRSRFRGQDGQALTITVRRGGLSRTLQTHVRERIQSAFAVSKATSPTAQQAKIWRGLTAGATGP
jgi:predicted metalloprotease with PDZ domain